MDSTRSKPDPVLLGAKNALEALPFIHAMPDEVLARIFVLLGQADRAAVACCCRRWAALSREAEALWRSISLGERCAVHSVVCQRRQLEQKR